MFGFQYSVAAWSANEVSAALFAAVGCASSIPTSVSNNGYALQSRASGIDGGCALYVSLYQFADAFHQCARTSETPCWASERYEAFGDAAPAPGTASANATATSERAIPARTAQSIPYERPADTREEVKGR